MNTRVLVALFLSVISLVTSKALAQSSAAQADVVTVGWFGPLSGPVASLGQQNLRGIELAIRDFAANRVRLLTEDDQFSVRNSFSAYEKLKAEKVFIMLSPTYNGVLALAPKADRDKILVANSLDASSEVAKAGEYVLGLGYYADGHGQNFARAISDHNAKRVAVFYNQGETFTQLIVNGFKEHYSGTIVLTEGYNPSSSDFRSSIVKMKSLNVDTVLLIGWDETGLFVRQANDAGFLPAVFGLASFTSPGFLSNAGRTKLEIYCLGWDPHSKQSQEIVRRYKNSYGEAPVEPLFVALGYDAMTLVLKALEKGSTVAEFQSNIYATSFKGLTGSYQLDRDGIVRGITSQNKVVRINKGVD
jgi:branched-chain amino acid transport system substrate-binding protein